MCEQKFSAKVKERRSLVFVILGVFVLALVVFRLVILRNGILLTTDNNIGNLALVKRNLPQAFRSWWVDFNLLGLASFNLPINWTWTSLLCLSAKMFINWIYAIDLVLSSVFLILFLRLRRIGIIASLLSSLIAFWVGTNLTLVYAGHTSKFAVVMFASLALLFIEKAVQTKKAAWSILAGGAVAIMFTEQQDVALFFGMPLGAYASFAVVRKEGWRNWKPILVRLIPMALMALLLGGSSVMNAYSANVEGVVSMSEENPEEKWEFCTQWSQPPAESIDFIAPGYTGWRSHEKEGPYWGKTGQSAGWDKTRQGFRNFRLESVYMGAIPVFLAIFALFFALSGKNKGSEGRAHIIFWGIATFMTLMLSFGKFTPLYSFFYKLPGISSIRCPNKLIQVFQLALAILSAYGLNAVLSDEARGKGSSGKVKGFSIAVMVIGVIALLYAGTIALGRGAYQNSFMQSGWGEFSPAIVKNMIRALVHGGIMTIICGGAFWAFVKLKGKARDIIAWSLVCLVVLDVLLLSYHYVKTMPSSYIVENDVTRVLKSNIGNQRLALATQAGFYNHWLTYLLPYHGIKTTNITQMPRMPEDYKKFLSSFAKNPLRMWRLSGVGCIMGPTSMMQQLMQMPEAKDAYQVLYAYNVASALDGGINVVPGTRAQPPQHVVLKMKASSPRYALLAGYQSAEPDQIIANLASDSVPLFDYAFISPETAKKLPALSGKGIIGSIEVRDYRSGRVDLKVSSDRPAILRAADKYDPGWKAWVDGKEVEVFRCDYICQGIYVEAGVHDVVMKYSPPNKGIWVQLAGYLLCFGAVCSLVCHKKKKTGETEEVNPDA